VRTNGSWVTGLGDGGALFFNDKFGGILVLMKGKFSIQVEVNRYDRQDPLPGLKTLAVSIIAKIYLCMSTEKAQLTGSQTPNEHE
jgi:hypothetical protein